LEKTLEADISKLQKTGHFYFALTVFQAVIGASRDFARIAAYKEVIGKIPVSGLATRTVKSELPYVRVACHAASEPS
jgi:hypothetical protein